MMDNGIQSIIIQTHHYLSDKYFIREDAMRLDLTVVIRIIRYCLDNKLKTSRVKNTELLPNFGVSLFFIHEESTKERFSSCGTCIVHHIAKSATIPCT